MITFFQGDNMEKKKKKYKKPEIIIDENKKPVTLTKQTNKKKIHKRNASETA